MSNTSLWDLPCREVDATTIDARFEAFDAAYPAVWSLFVRFAHEARKAGHARFSADALLHRIRWECNVAYKPAPGEFKINDHFSSRYARKLMAQDESFREFFETRRLREVQAIHPEREDSEPPHFDSDFGK